MAPLAEIAPSASVGALRKPRSPTLPDVESEATRLAPFRLTLPPPLTLTASAVITPLPLSVAPVAAATEAVEPSRFQAPAIISVPLCALVAPL